MVLVNGQPEKFISVADRGLNYGDGLFETMVVVDGRVRFFEDHLQRLKVGCDKLALPFPAREEIESDLSKLIAIDPESRFVFKMLITRGESGRGYLVSEDSSTNRISSRHAIPAELSALSRRGLKVHVCKTRLAINSALAGIKHANRLEQVMASIERLDTHFDEGLMLSTDHYLVEGTKSNVFWQKDGEYFTPDLQHSGVVGVCRTKVIEMLEKNTKIVNIGRYRLGDIQAADLVFMTNSTMLITQVVQLDETKWSKNPHIATLRDELVNDK